MLFCVAAPLNCAKASKEKTKSKPLAEAKKAAPKNAAGSEEPGRFGIGLRAPDFTVKDADGKPVKLSDYKGRAVVLTFWDVTSDPSKKQMKALEAGLGKKKADVAFLAVTQFVSDAKSKEAAADLKKSGIGATPLFDANSEAGKAFQLTGVPYFALIDKAGLLQGAGVYDVTMKLSTMNFIDLAAMIAGGGKAPHCEFAETEFPKEYEKLFGKDAPNFRLADLNGNEESPVYYKGFSNLLIVFWSPSCPHCLRELPRLQAFYNSKAKAMNLKIVSIVGVPEKGDQNYVPIVSAAKQVALRDKLTFPVVLDVGQTARIAYGAEGVPALFYVGIKGKIEHAWRGESLFVGENIECAAEKPAKQGAAGKGR